MIRDHESPTELEQLLESLCEEGLTAEECARLEQLVLVSPEACWKYLTYLDLHGTLYWDAAGAGSAEPLSSQEIPVYQPSVVHASAADPSVESTVAKPVRSIDRRSHAWIAAVAACLILVTVAVWNLPRPTDDHRAQTPVTPQKTLVAEIQINTPKTMREHGPPVDLSLDGQPDVNLVQPAQPNERQTPQPVAPAIPPLSSREVVAKINDAIQSQWTERNLTPSVRADDAEWLRRIHLDLIGRVPTVSEAEAFLANRRDSKRQELVEQLLDDPAYVRNFTTKWTNLLIGRSSNPLVDRDAFQKFLRISFAANRPWNQIVAELISAEGPNTENGATNFLIAHLNNDATPATAVVARVFLGRQVQCNQCHNNPFDESKQVAFWELKSFFQQTTSVPRQRRDPNSGRLLATFTELVTQDAGGPTYFETSAGLMRVAYPRLNDIPIDPSADTNRRIELARLMTYGEQPQLAAAFVNRMWDHFFGAGFTRQVDDLGPHQPHSHPELLAALSDQFIRSGYDVKQLIRWICRSDTYQLSSRFSTGNQDDDPATGELPAFSRLYVKSMTAEQTYDSFLTATKAHQVGALDWTMAEQNRQKWLQQFVVAFHTDENDEAMTFEGTIGNALSLMNGPLIEKALDVSPGSFLGEVVRQKSSDNDKIRSLCLAALSRPPAPAELSAMKKLVREASRSDGSGNPSREAYQDLFWALLNSNEFALVH